MVVCGIGNWLRLMMLLSMCIWIGISCFRILLDNRFGVVVIVWLRLIEDRLYIMKLLVWCVVMIWLLLIIFWISCVGFIFCRILVYRLLEYILLVCLLGFIWFILFW